MCVLNGRGQISHLQYNTYRVSSALFASPTWPGRFSAALTIAMVPTWASPTSAGISYTACMWERSVRILNLLAMCTPSSNTREGFSLVKPASLCKCANWMAWWLSGSLPWAIIARSILLFFSLAIYTHRLSINIQKCAFHCDYNYLSQPAMLKIELWLMRAKGYTCEHPNALNNHAR